MGQSVTQSTLLGLSEPSMSPRHSPRCSRTADSDAATVGASPAPKSSRSPSSTGPTAARSSSSRSPTMFSLMAAMASKPPPSAMRAYASPRAPPRCAASSTSPFLMRTLLMPFAYSAGTRMALTCPPADTAPSNTLNPQPETMALTSVSSRPKRRSGLSEPNLSMASAYVMRGNTSGRSIPPTRENRSRARPSAIEMTASWSTKLISMSNCVNSGCLSALRSSSLKHRAIW
mmetsp:Transcript_13801/g.57675  ORF Transcript_13801/g.57675 Transcript_13801/m.57675 type:complete len:231 (-) Transcript_13801:747-1439(-)